MMSMEKQTFALLQEWLLSMSTLKEAWNPILSLRTLWTTYGRRVYAKPVGHPFWSRSDVNRHFFGEVSMPVLFSNTGRK